MPTANDTAVVQGGGNQGISEVPGNYRTGTTTHGKQKGVKYIIKVL